MTLYAFLGIIAVLVTMSYVCWMIHSAASNHKILSDMLIKHADKAVSLSNNAINLSINIQKTAEEQARRTTNMIQAIAKELESVDGDGAREAEDRFYDILANVVDQMKEERNQSKEDFQSRMEDDLK